MKSKKSKNNSKILFGIFIAVVLIAITIFLKPLVTGNATNVASCTDSDSGIVRLVYGMVSGIDSNGTSYTNQDYCFNTTTLNESYCSGTSPASKAIVCNATNGAICVNGACVRSTTNTPYRMHVGSGMSIEGESVLLANVGSSGDIVVNVEGHQETISKNSEEVVNCILVRNVATYYVDNKIQRQALIDISKPELPPETACEISVPRVLPYLYVGEAINVKGQPVRLENVGSSGQAVISVNSTQETLSLNTPEIINGIEFTLDSTTYTDTTATRRASITVTEVSYGDTPLFSTCYPNQFTTTPGLLANVRVVIGQNASSSDTFAALDVYSNLQHSMINPCTGIVPSFPEPVFLTDDDVQNPSSYNLIIVGTEGANTLISQYSINRNYPHGSIQFVQNGNNAALLVIGKTTTGTRDAAIALKNLENVSFNTSVLCVNPDKSVYVC